jgi:hypothetical protein
LEHFLYNNFENTLVSNGEMADLPTSMELVTSSFSIAMTGILTGNYAFHYKPRIRRSGILSRSLP